jgi:hypothetical protein
MPSPSPPVKVGMKPGRAWQASTSLSITGEGIKTQDLEEGQTTTFPSGDFVWITVRGPREFDIWCVSIQPCIIEPSHGGMADVKGILKATEQSSGQRCNGGE